MRKVFGKCKGDGYSMETAEGDRQSASRWPSEQRCVPQTSEPVTHKDHVAAEEGRHVDEDLFSSHVEAERVAIEGIRKTWVKKDRKPLQTAVCSTRR